MNRSQRVMLASILSMGAILGDTIGGTSAYYSNPNIEPEKPEPLSEHAQSLITKAQAKRERRLLDGRRKK